jgi:hypothetical protein
VNEWSVVIVVCGLLGFDCPCKALKCKFHLNSMYKNSVSAITNMYKLLFGFINTSMGSLLDSEVTYCRFMVVMEMSQWFV